MYRVYCMKMVKKKLYKPDLSFIKGNAYKILYKDLFGNLKFFYSSFMKSKISRNSKELISKECFALKEPARAQKANGFTSPRRFKDLEMPALLGHPKKNKNGALESNFSYFKLPMKFLMRPQLG